MMDIKRLGILAGGGSLPSQLVQACLKQGIEPYIVCFEGFATPDLPGNHNHIWVKLGAAGKTIQFLKQNDVRDLVMIGYVKRPSFFDMAADFKGLQILSKIGARSVLGDNSLLSLLRQELEHEGFHLHGIQKFCRDLLIGEGALGAYKPGAKDKSDIDLGLRVTQALGALDVGQSAIVQNGVVIGVEGKEGTDGLILRCADLLDGNGGGVLVKSCKPGQDKDLDLPTIGLQTVENAYKSGLHGIALHAHHVLLTDAKAIAQQADQYKIFVTGINLPKTENNI